MKKKSPRSSPLLITGIGELYTLDGAARKKGRRIKPSDLSLVTKAALVIEDGRLVYAGPQSGITAAKARALARRSAHDEDLRGATVLPGMVECHTHLVFAGNRAAEFERRNQGESYQSIARSGGGIRATVDPTRQASESELVRLAQARVDRYLAQGVTTIEAKSGYGLTVEAEIKMLRAIRRLKRARIVPTFLGAHAIPKEFEGASGAWIDELIDKALPRLSREGLAERVDIFVEDGYFDLEVARRYLRAARKLGLAVTIHADQLTRSGGAQLAVEMKAHSADHLLRVNEADIKKLATSEVTCVLLPSADLYMNCPYPPARKLIDAGARVAIATDFNPGSAPSQDTSLAGVLARVQMKMSMAEVIAAYTVGAAHALGLEGEVGSLSVGKCADFVVLEGGLNELFLEIGRQPVARVYRLGQRLT